MPSIPLHPSPSSLPPSPPPNPLPRLLHTPSGLAILEIQGTINISASDPSDGMHGETPIGSLVFPDYAPTSSTSDSEAWMKRVYLYVGRHQRLTGEVKKLAKPIGVIRRRQGGGDDQAGEDELEIVEVVRWKVLFGGRPEPVDGGS